MTEKFLIRRSPNEKSPLKGIYAGFIASVVLSILMVLKSIMGMLPNMPAIKTLAGMAHNHLGLPKAPMLG